MSEVADTAARWKVARPLACGGQHHPVTVRQVGPANNDCFREEVAPNVVNLERMGQEVVDMQLRISRPYQVATVMASGRSPGNTPTQNYRGRNLEFSRHTSYLVRC